MIEDKYSKLYLETKNYKNKSREIIIKVLKEHAANRRDEKAKIEMRLGYFTSDLKYFREGEELSKLKYSIEEKSEEI